MGLRFRPGNPLVVAGLGAAVIAILIGTALHPPGGRSGRGSLPSEGITVADAPRPAIPIDATSTAAADPVSVEIKHPLKDGAGGAKAERESDDSADGKAGKHTPGKGGDAAGDGDQAGGAAGGAGAGGGGGTGGDSTGGSTGGSAGGSTGGGSTGGGSAGGGSAGGGGAVNPVPTQAPQAGAGSRVNCPNVKDRLPAVPAAVAAEVNANLAELEQQIADANMRIAMIEANPVGDPNFIQNTVLGPLRDRRVATLDRIAIAIGRVTTRPSNLAELAPCTLNP